ncbi:hypothetical protein EU538_11375 [Candidatus Thorarchaeota archaeon]|jgi:hypothetical protein|nr:MAG: hypothetical protein EU538_11375 [Candidatus Thorarchaeota archaeon]
MTVPDDTSARLTLKVAGAFQEARDLWVRRLDAYFSQLEQLVHGQWLTSDDIRGILRESRLAAREAIDGFGEDLSTQLTHESSGLIGRFQTERNELIEQIDDLEKRIDRMLSTDQGSIRRENENLRDTIMSMPEFELLTLIQEQGETTYKKIAKVSDCSVKEVRKLVRLLSKSGHVSINKSTRPHEIHFLHAPWGRRKMRESDEGDGRGHMTIQQSLIPGSY